MNELDRRGIEDLDKGRLLFPACIEEGARQAIAGIVHQRIDMAPGLFQLMNDGIGRPLFREVLSDGEGRDAIFVLKLSRERIQPVQTARSQGHVPPLGSVLTGKFCPKTG